MDRLSVIVASILLVYALLPFVQLPDRSLVFQPLGVMFVFQVNFSTLIGLLSASMAAAGVSWLLVDHPRLARMGPPASAAQMPRPRAAGWAAGLAQLPDRAAQGFQRLRLAAFLQHWLIPALSAWIIGAPLRSLAVGVQWWAVFAFGGVLLAAVLVAEYIAADPAQVSHGPAAVGLTAASYALLLILIIALAAAGSRLYVLLPALFAALFGVTLRGLYLRLGGRWCFAWATVISLVVAQAAAALHYWPLSPLRYGLALLGLAYALASMAGGLEEGRLGRALWLEPSLMLLVLWGLAGLVRG